MAEDRRKRLKALKARRAATDGAAPAADGDAKPVLKFRNYTPQTEQLSEHKLAPVALPEVDAMVQRELDVAACSSSAAANVDASGAGAGLEAPLNIAPKKVDWDLKRDVEKRL